MTRSSASPRPLWPFLVAAAAALVYVNSIANGFALDDIPLVRDNAGIRELSDAPRLFVSPYWPDGAVAGLYRPVTALSFLLTRLALGESAAGFHAVNVLLHALVAALVWLQARDVGVHYGTALVTAALFAVHPLHTEAVANVAGRAELLGALFVLAAWWLQRAAACRATPAGRAAVLVGAAACYLFAVLSKENTVLAPLLFALVERMSRDRPGRAGPGLGPVAAAYTAAFVAAMLLRVNALGGIRGAGDVAYLDNPAAFAGPAARVATALWVQLKYA